MSVVMYRLMDKKVDEESYFLNEDGKKDYTRHMDFTNQFGILNPFFVVDETGKRIHYRYIRGCSFFEVERQDKEGFIANYQNSILQFKAGADIVCDLDEKNSEDIILSKFLDIHVHNVDSDNHNPNKHDKLFFKFDPKKELKKEVDRADIEDNAMELLISLKGKDDKLLSIRKLFEETQGLSDPDQIYLRLREIVKGSPERLLNSVADRRNEVLGDIELALKMNVIGRDVKGFYLVQSSSLLFEIGPKEKTGNKMFADFLSTEEGQVIYKQILYEKSLAEVKMTAPAGMAGEEKKE